MIGWDDEPERKRSSYVDALWSHGYAVLMAAFAGYALAWILLDG